MWKLRGSPKWPTLSLCPLPRLCTYCCCCCCQVASVISDSVRPHGRQPTRLPHPWDSPGKNTGVGCHFLLQCMKVKSEREVAQSCRLLATPWTAAHQAPPSMGLSRQEYWRGVPLSSPYTYWLFLKVAIQKSSFWKIRNRDLKNWCSGKWGIRMILWSVLPVYILDIFYITILLKLDFIMQIKWKF